MLLTLLAFLSNAMAFRTSPASNDANKSEAKTSRLKSIPLSGAEESTVYHGGVRLGASSPGSRAATTVGTTWYEPVHNGSMGRNVVFDQPSGWVHFVWMRKDSDTAIRKIAYAAYNVSTTTWLHGGVSGNGKVISGNNGGYTTIDITSAGAAAIAYHEGPSGPLYASKANIDQVPPQGTFSQPWPSAAGPPNCQNKWTGGWEDNSAYIWPVIDYDSYDGNTILHVVSIESPGCPEPPGCAGEIQSIIYYRNVFPDWDACFPNTTDTLGTFIDSSYNIAPIVRSDPNSDNVALLWLKPFYYESQPDPAMNPCGEIGVGYYQWQNDVVMLESTNGGLSFIDGTATYTNISDYTAGHTIVTDQIPYKVYTDVTAMYDHAGVLHVVWGTPIYDVDGDNPCNPLYASKIWHWDNSRGCITLVYDASRPRFHCDTGAWNMSTAKMNVSECDLGGGDYGLYVSFTRFGAHVTADGDTSDDCSIGSVNPIANGDIYVVGSSNSGQTWGPGGSAPLYEVGVNAGNGSPAKIGTAVNLTNTWTDSCEAGDCLNEHWPSMAMRTSTDLHVFYMEDHDAGTNIQPDEGVATENDMKYLTYECFTPDPICAATYGPFEIGHPNFISPQDQADCTGPTTIDVEVTIQNTGNQTADYSVSTSAAWISPSSATGTAPVGCTNTSTETFTIGPITEEGTFVTTLNVSACGGEITGTIPVMIHCYCKFFLPEYEILSTPCWSVGVWNEPRSGIADKGDEGNMYWYLEEIPLMYDNGPVLTFCDDTTRTWFSIFEGSDSNAFFEPRDSITKSIGPNYEYAVARFTDHDPLNDPILEGTMSFYVPTHPDTCVLVECLVLTNITDTAVCFHIGEGVDWDIPDGEDGSENQCGKDDGRNMLYQYGPPGTPEEMYYGGASICGTIVGGVVLTNKDWVYKTAGYLPAQIGGLLARQATLEAETPDSLQDLSSFYVLEQNVTLQPGDTISYCKVKASSLIGLGSEETPAVGTLRDLIDKGRAWAKNNVDCGSPCTAGDANGSGSVDIDDVVYLIGYIFSGGPPPVPYICCGDANGSCAVDIDDVVYEIGYIFSGGPPPQASCSACSCGIWE